MKRTRQSQPWRIVLIIFVVFSIGFLAYVTGALIVYMATGK